jgi:hypothetical protein
MGSLTLDPVGLVLVGIGVASLLSDCHAEDYLHKDFTNILADLRSASTPIVVWLDRPPSVGSSTTTTTTASRLEEESEQEQRQSMDEIIDHEEKKDEEHAIMTTNHNDKSHELETLGWMLHANNDQSSSGSPSISSASDTSGDPAQDNQPEKVKATNPETPCDTTTTTDSKATTIHSSGTFTSPTTARRVLLINHNQVKHHHRHRGP